MNIDTEIVGIVNLSPESDNNVQTETGAIIHQVGQLLDEGADWIDIGAQSTRPGQKQVSENEELRRLGAIIKTLCEKFPQIQISIDTTRSIIAREAIQQGAKMINDISGCSFDPEIGKVAKEFEVPIVITHSSEFFYSMHELYERTLKDCPDMLLEYFSRKRSVLREKYGLREQQFIFDPGIGFGKGYDENMEVIKNLNKLVGPYTPLYIGLSRKKFTGTIGLTKQAEDRDHISSLLHMHCIQNGVRYIRTHNVKYAKEMIRTVRALHS